jgi:uncharacterized membrane protein
MVVVFGFSLIVPTTACLSYMGHYFIDKQRRGPFIYLFAFSTGIFAVSYTIVCVILLIYSLRIFFKIHQHSSTEEKAIRIFKERVEKNF